MPFKKYKPWRFFGRKNTLYFRKQYAGKLVKFPMPPFEIPPAVKELGLAIYDPNDVNFPDKKPKKQVEIDHPAFKTFTIKDHVLYKKDACLMYDGSESLCQGVEQASILTNTIVRMGFPEQLLNIGRKLFSAKLQNSQNLLGNWTEKHLSRLKDAIMHAERYDASLEMLPRRHDPVLFWIKYAYRYGTPQKDKNHILLDDLYRYAALFLPNSQKLWNPRICSDRDADVSGCLPSTIWLQTVDSKKYPKKPVNFVIQSRPHIILQSDRKPAAVWADGREIQTTISDRLPDIHPIDPRIDLFPTNLYHSEPILPRMSRQLHMHTMMWSHEQNQKYPWTRTELSGKALLFCFGGALAQAARIYGQDFSGELEEPLMVRGVQVVDGQLYLIAFQLNTLNLNSSNGRKNIAWIEQGQKLYEPGNFWENYEQVQGLNPDTFDKFCTLLFADLF